MTVNGHSETLLPDSYQELREEVGSLPLVEKLARFGQQPSNLECNVLANGASLSPGVTRVSIDEAATELCHQQNLENSACQK